ncbi:MAG: 50S ribosomal protein L14 [Candidatus Aenigmatarchaeota archaeon]|nr:MAG: 50S ribosomal protein L14 [Candidatus Aenigmarchaeota archaeon]
MKPVKAKISKPITLRTVLTCIDNSGAKKLSVIAVKTYKGKRRRLPRAGIGDIVICSVVNGNEKMRHKVVYAVIVRQKKEYRRPDGTRIKFEDNAAVVINPKNNEPQGTEIRGIVAKEVIQRFSAIGKIATQVV